MKNTKTLTVRDFYRKLNNNNEIPTIEGQGSFTADEMIWFGEQVLKSINTHPPLSCNSAELKVLAIWNMGIDATEEGNPNFDQAKKHSVVKEVIERLSGKKKKKKKKKILKDSHYYGGGYIGEALSQCE